MLNDPTLANGQHGASRRDLIEVVAEVVVELVKAKGGATREAEARGDVVERVDRLHHVTQLHLVRRRTDHQARYAAQIREIEATVVRRAVVTHEAGAVEDHAHGELLDGDIVHHLVVCTLHERRVDGAERLEALDRHACGKCDSMLLGDANVVRALGEALPELVNTRAAGHGGGDGHHRAVRRRDVDQRVREHRRVRGSLRWSGELFARRDVELGHTVILVRGGLGRGVAFALVGLHVQQHWLRALAVADVLEDRHQVVEVVSVDRANVVEAELLKQSSARHHAAGILVDLGVGLLDLGRKELVDRLSRVAERLERFRRDQPCCVRRERARWPRASS
mmetsp:Transcript_14383/g.37312  ORF Transcript_14383/g.37312 Transcript_14383/m.37312 type:complete len:337 (-) Transcript_14383:730-1740(-)